MRFGHSYPPPALRRYSVLDKYTNQAGAIQQIQTSASGRGAGAGAADGDRYFVYLYLDGTETKMEITTNKGTDKGIFDLYVNGVLDSSGYDDYNGSAAYVDREITLTVPVVAGANVFEFRVNGKNALSTDYLVRFWGVTVQ